MASRTTSRPARRLSRDTGFPEPFDHGSNTTLPHPEADLSPNACISHDDLIVDHALKRKKLSFLHRYKHNRLPPHGLSTGSELVSSVLSLSLTGTHQTRESESTQRLARVSTTSIPSKDETESVQSKKDDETPPTSPDSVHHHSKRGGFLSKLRRG